MKTCTKCGRQLPATTEFFRKQKGGKDGLGAQCKDCVKDRMKIYRATPEYKEMHSIYAKKWRDKHLKRAREINRKSRNKNRDKYNSVRRDKYANDPEYKDKKRINNKNRKRNKEHFTPEQWEKVRTIRRRYRNNSSEKSRENVRERQRRFVENNPEYMRNKYKRRNEELHDSYIAAILSKETNVDVKLIYKHPEIIEARRNQIKLSRIVRKLTSPYTKICNCCYEEFPRTTEYYYYKKSTKSFSGMCKKCTREKIKTKYYEKR